jgi:hypothetical protein
MKRSKLVILATLGAALGLGIPADVWAGKAAHKHDGFFLRLSSGIGYASTEIEDATARLEFNGGTGDANIAIGGMVSQNLALHGTLLGWFISDPDVEGFDSGGSFAGEIAGDITMSAIGIGVTYYFMPTNLYLSGTLGLGQLEFDLPGVGQADTDNGLILEGTLGKEWWVSSNWGLGLAGALSLHSFPDDGSDESWSGPSLALRFSATFN